MCRRERGWEGVCLWFGTVLVVLPGVGKQLSCRFHGVRGKGSDYGAQTGWSGWFLRSERLGFALDKSASSWRFHPSGRGLPKDGIRSRCPDLQNLLQKAHSLCMFCFRRSHVKCFDTNRFWHGFRGCPHDRWAETYTLHCLVVLKAAGKKFPVHTECGL